MIQAGARVKWSSTLETAILYEEFESLKLLLQARADVNIPQGAIITASKKGSDKCVHALIDAGADVNSLQGVEALITASAMGSVNCMNILIEAGADGNKLFKGRSALSVAAMKGSSTGVDILLKSGADVNFRDNKGRSVLHNAVNSTDVQSVKFLLEAGADVNSTDNEGNTAMFLSPIWFSMRGLNCYRLLLNAGVKVNVRNNHGFNALTHFLKNLGDDERYKRSRTATDANWKKNS